TYAIKRRTPPPAAPPKAAPADLLPLRKTNDEASRGQILLRCLPSTAVAEGCRSSRAALLQASPTTTRNAWRGAPCNWPDPGRCAAPKPNLRAALMAYLCVSPKLGAGRRLLSRMQ